MVDKLIGEPEAEAIEDAYRKGLQTTLVDLEDLASKFFTELALARFYIGRLIDTDE